MTMFLGKISTEEITAAPSKISNNLPKGIIFEEGEYYCIKNGKKIQLKSISLDFKDFFLLNQHQ